VPVYCIFATDLNSDWFIIKRTKNTWAASIHPYFFAQRTSYLVLWHIS